MARATAKININDNQLQRLMRGRDGEVGRIMAGFAGIATQETRRVADERVNRRTGRYIRGIHSKMVAGSQGNHHVRVIASAPHSRILEKGSKPHVIVPRRASVLRFEVGGRVVFATRVNHPGTQPYRILQTGARRAGKRLLG